MLAESENFDQFIQRYKNADETAARTYAKERAEQERREAYMKIFDETKALPDGQGGVTTYDGLMVKGVRMAFREYKIAVEYYMKKYANNQAFPQAA